MVKILTFYAPKEKDYEKVEGESLTDQLDHEPLPDLIARVIRGEVRAPHEYGYTLGMDDDSDEAFDSCDDENDVDIVPCCIMDESGFSSAVSQKKDNDVPPHSSVASVEAPSDSAAVEKEEVSAATDETSVA